MASEDRSRTHARKGAVSTGKIGAAKPSPAWDCAVCNAHFPAGVIPGREDTPEECKDGGAHTPKK